MILVLDLINSMKKLKSIMDKSKYLKCVRSDNPLWDKLYKESSELYINLRNVNL